MMSLVQSVLEQQRIQLAATEGRDVHGDVRPRPRPTPLPALAVHFLSGALQPHPVIQLNAPPEHHGELWRRLFIRDPAPASLEVADVGLPKRIGGPFRPGFDPRRGSFQAGFDPRRRFSRLTEADVLAIRESSEASSVLARRYGVDVSTIRRTRRGQAWKHLGRSMEAAAG